MKKMIFGFALIATCVASATTVTSANTFGVLKVTSSAKETIISVPWVKVGDGGAIDADSLVLTSNLTAGDKLFAYDTTTGKYYTWTLQTPGETWGTSSENEGDYLVASKSSLPRGAGLILVRSNTSNPIYLYGQYASTGGNTSNVTAATDDAAVFTLIAPPSTQPVDLNTQATMSAPVKGDMIILENGTAYTYRNPVTNYVKSESLKWCKQEVTGDIVNYTDSGVTIPAGRGAWYMRKKGATTSSTITWAN